MDLEQIKIRTMIINNLISYCLSANFSTEAIGVLQKKHLSLFNKCRTMHLFSEININKILKFYFNKKITVRKIDVCKE